MFLPMVDFQLCFIILRIFFVVRSEREMTDREDRERRISNEEMTIRHSVRFANFVYTSTRVSQVEEFLLMPVEEALNTIKTDLATWKPNCALVMIDFALRHGFLDPDHPVSGRERTPPDAVPRPQTNTVPGVPAVRFLCG